MNNPKYNQETFLKELESMTSEELNRIIEENGKVKLVKPFIDNKSKNNDTMEVINHGN